MSCPWGTACWYQTEPHRPFPPLPPVKDRLPLPDILPFDGSSLKACFDC
jgi:hypothetical protein